MAKYLRFLIAFLSIASSAWAGNASIAVPLSSWTYAALDSVYMEAGMVPPDDARPWSVAEFRNALGRIDPETLSEAGKGCYRRIADELDLKATYSEKYFSFRTDPSLNPEFFFRVNMGRDASAVDRDYRWAHGYAERPALLSVPLEILFGDSTTLFADLSFKEEPNTVESGLAASGAYPDGVLDNFSNILLDDPSPRLDLYFPFRAYLAFAGPFWSLKFGRDQVDWGNGSTGNLMISDSPDFFDMLNVAFFGDRFKLSGLYVVMDPFLPDGTRQAYSAFIGHRFDVRVANRVQIAISESVAFGGQFAPELLRDTNMMMVFHNWMDPDRMNSLLTVEVSANPWKYMEIYGQIAMDEFATEYELERSGGGGPPIFGYIAGARGALPFGPGYVKACAEWALTSPWLYNRRAAPYYYDVRRYWSLTTDQYEYIVKPLGYEYGSDAIVWFLSAEYDVPGGLESGVSLAYAKRGEAGVGAAWNPQPGDLPPTGTAEESLTLGLRASYPFFNWLSAEGGLNLCFVSGRDNIEGAYSRDIEIYFGASASLP